MKPTINQLLNNKFWEKINPGLHIDDKDFLNKHKPLHFSKEALDCINKDLLEEGYFQLKPIDWELPFSAMLDALTKFVDMGWPPVLAYVYDEFFLVPFKLSKVLSNILGQDFKQLPDFWAWYIDPLLSQSGWSPHRDKGMDSLMSNGSPMSLTLWIPFTDVIPLNGCIYIVPKNLDPYFANPTGGNYQFEYQNIRALPASAGSILGWNQAVLHWGSRSSKKAQVPRVSIGLEFQRGDIEPFNKPLFSVDPPVELKTRLILIGKQILQYKHLYKLSDDVAALAEEMKNLQ